MAEVNLNMKKGNSSELSNLSFKAGTLYFTEDTGNIYLDIKDGNFTEEPTNLNNYRIKLYETDLATKQDNIRGTAGQFVMIGNDNLPVAVTLPQAEETEF